MGVQQLPNLATNSTAAVVVVVTKLAACAASCCVMVVHGCMICLWTLLRCVCAPMCMASGSTLWVLCPTFLLLLLHLLQAVDEMRHALAAEQAKTLKLEVQLAELNERLGSVAELERELARYRKMEAEAATRKGSSGLWGYISGQ